MSGLPLHGFRNLLDLFNARCQAQPRAIAVTYPLGSPAREWISHSWEEWREILVRIMSALRDLGMTPGDRLALYAKTTVPWIALDNAAIFLGGVSVPIYETTTDVDLRRILSSTQAKFVFVENLATAKRLRNLQETISIITDAPFTQPEKGIHSFADLLQAGAGNNFDFREMAQAMTRQTHAAIYHTSGTTGEMKPVSLTHGHLLEVMEQLVARFKDRFSSADIGISMLPYSHIFGRVEWLCHLTYGGRAIMAYGFDHLGDYLRLWKPTILFTVPRVLEKIHLGIYEKISRLPARRARIARFFLAKLSQEKLPAWIQWIGERLVYTKVRDGFGGHLRVAITAGAPLSPGIARFFSQLGVNVLQAYGLTETTGAVTVTQGESESLGSVGKPLEKIEIRLADDGEVLVRGPTVFGGYATEPRTADEWFATGDLGEFDSHGNLRIIGRKKDLLVTAGGKKIAPQKIEALFALDPLFEQAVVLGDQRPYLVALLYLNPTAVAGLSSNDVQALVGEHIKQLNQGLAAFETIKKFAVLSEPLMPEKGELTLSQKPRRFVIAERYQEALNALY